MEDLCVNLWKWFGIICVSALQPHSEGFGASFGYGFVQYHSCIWNDLSKDNVLNCSSS